MADATPPLLAQDPTFGPLAQLTERLTGLDMTRLLIYLTELVDATALPWLGEQFHIMGQEGWDFAADESARRALIQSAIELHRYKGTPWAVKQALSKLGLTRIDLIEHPEGAHWAEFDLDMAVIDRPLTEANYSQIMALIETYKPARSHLRHLTVSAVCRSTVRTACVTTGGVMVTIQPYQITALTAPALRPAAASAQHAWGVTTLYPRSSEVL